MRPDAPLVTKSYGGVPEFLGSRVSQRLYLCICVARINGHCSTTEYNPIIPLLSLRQTLYPKPPPSTPTSQAMSSSWWPSNALSRYVAGRSTLNNKSQRVTIVSSVKAWLIAFIPATLHLWLLWIVLLLPGLDPTLARTIRHYVEKRDVVVNDRVFVEVSSSTEATLVESDISRSSCSTSAPSSSSPPSSGEPKRVDGCSSVDIDTDVIYVAVPPSNFPQFDRRARLLQSGFKIASPPTCNRSIQVTLSDELSGDLPDDGENSGVSGADAGSRVWSLGTHLSFGPNRTTFSGLDAPVAFPPQPVPFTFTMPSEGWMQRLRSLDPFNPTSPASPSLQRARKPSVTEDYLSDSSEDQEQDDETPFKVFSDRRAYFPGLFGKRTSEQNRILDRALQEFEATLSSPELSSEDDTGSEGYDENDHPRACDSISTSSSSSCSSPVFRANVDNSIPLTHSRAAESRLPPEGRQPLADLITPVESYSDAEDEDDPGFDTSSETQVDDVDPLDECPPGIIRLTHGTVTYEICKKLGGGGYGNVYLATVLDNGYQVAIKVVNKIHFYGHKDGRKSLLNELDLWKRITESDRPFLTRLICSFDDESNIYYVMVRNDFAIHDMYTDFCRSSEAAL